PLCATGAMVIGLAYATLFLGASKAVAQSPMHRPVQGPASGVSASGVSASGREAMWNTPAPTQYRILAKPTHPHSKSAIFTPEVPLPKIESQSVQPYAYGWFGARTLPNASRHFGYRSTFTQWTIR
ncbi:MAG: hypothetical protein ACK52S_16280, partial [Pirellula sp.]